MANYLAEVRKMEKFFDRFEVRYVPHLDNRDIDYLALIASLEHQLCQTSSSRSYLSIWSSQQKKMLKQPN
jgi:hypothetical protein